ncbi:MAG: Lrp/AsnC family transcriptional regulator, partial [Nanoarchaeota archaeon]|nr:Lrp/AsnC family transcriptional regulator [Nanoarchaeota archaeon]MBU1597624.1 Lrp/AsnC family transcriptional regulator [Nanoarchaeota archaeon]
MTQPDFNLLYLKSEEARISLKDISKLTRKSSQRLKYTLSNFEKNQILKEPHCVIDYSSFGLILFRVYFRSAYINEKEKTNIIKELINNPYVISVYELTGQYDLVTEFAAPNPSKFNKELKKISEDIPTLQYHTILLNVVTYVCPRKYLIKSETIQQKYYEKIIGGDREKEKFLPNEIKVIKNLILNPLTKLTNLAKKTELNIKTIRKIMKNLAQRKIIRGYKQNIDTEKLGINKTRLFLRIHNISQEKENKLIKFLLQTKEVVKINKTVGDWDMEIDIETMQKNRIRYILSDIREEFKEIIEKYNLIEHYNTYKTSYLPQYLFNGSSKEEIQI